jgi:hypothetical protein
VNTWRNRLAWRLCTWILTYIADDSYAQYIGGSIRYGMAAAKRDIREGFDPLAGRGEGLS